jgi:hypothetical protein
MKMKPLIEINDDQIIPKGTRFRQYGIGLNVTDPKDDFYEYMLAFNPSDQEYLLLVCVEGYKAGNSLALVKAHNDPYSVNGKAIKFSMGTDNTFILESFAVLHKFEDF